MWPASALLTGNGVAFVLRVPGTQHGDWWSLRGWWIFAGDGGGLAALEARDQVARRARLQPVEHRARPLLPRRSAARRAEPLDFWWGPMSWWLALALAIIVTGGFAILRRLQLLRVALGFWVGVRRRHRRARARRPRDDRALAPRPDRRRLLLVGARHLARGARLPLLHDHRPEDRAARRRGRGSSTRSSLGLLARAPDRADARPSTRRRSRCSARSRSSASRLPAAARSCRAACVGRRLALAARGSALAVLRRRARARRRTRPPRRSPRAAAARRSCRRSRSSRRAASSRSSTSQTARADRARPRRESVPATARAATGCASGSCPGARSGPADRRRRSSPARRYRLHQDAAAGWALASDTPAAAVAAPRRRSRVPRGHRLTNVAPVGRARLPAGLLPLRHVERHDGDDGRRGLLARLQRRRLARPLRRQLLRRAPTRRTGRRTAGCRASALFENVHGTFANVTRQTHAGLAVQGDGCVAADLNGDGGTDLVVTTTTGVDAALEQRRRDVHRRRAELPASTDRLVHRRRGRRRERRRPPRHLRRRLRRPERRRCRTRSRASRPTSPASATCSSSTRATGTRFREVGVQAGLEAAAFAPRARRRRSPT